MRQFSLAIRASGFLAIAAFFAGMTVASGHDHEAQGPRGGQLIELGKEEFHAELLVDEETNRVSILLLDGTAERVALSETRTAIIDVFHGEERERFVLKSQPEVKDPEGSTSRYGVVSKELVNDLHSGANPAMLMVKFDGKVYKQSFKWTVGHNHHGR